MMLIKKCLLLISTIMLFGAISVYAEEKYNILVDSNGTFTLKDSSNNLIDDSDVAKYENGNLILGENKYFNQIKTMKDIMITSNDKGVYIKELTTKDGNTYLDVDVTINNLKVLDSETAIFKVDVGGNFVMKESETSSHANCIVKGSIEFLNSIINNIDTSDISANNEKNEKYAIKVTNSTLNNSLIISGMNGGFYVKDSKVNTKNFYTYGYTYIENSTIQNAYITNQRSDETFLVKDSTINTTRQISIFSESEEQIVIFQNSEIASGEIYIPKAGSIFEGCIINSTSDLFVSKNVSIKDTNANLERGLSKWGVDSSGMLTIEDSEINGSFFVGNSNILDDTSVVTIKNSLINANSSSTFRYKTVIEDSEFKLQQFVHFYKDVEIDNSKGNFLGMTMAHKNFTIKDSVLGFTNKIEGAESYPPLIVNQDFIINNSNIVIDNIENNNKAACIQGNLILDDRIIPVDNEKTELKLIKLEDDSEEKSKCSTCYDANKPIHIFVYNNDDFSRYVKLATTRKAILKVKEGTWLDGTKDDVEIDYLYGEPFNIDELPEKVRGLINSKLGSWSVEFNDLDTTKDLDIEFKYDLISQDTNDKQILNPDTADYLFSLLIILVITSVIFVFMRIKKWHNFLNN